MTGILYTRYKHTIILRPTIKGKQIELYTPTWIMKEVIEGKRNFGHFNPKSDMKLEKQKRI